MKQYITPEQLNELTPEQKERLREWWRPRIKDGIISPYCVDSGFYGAGSDPYDNAMPDKDALPLLSIGQCIELANVIQISKDMGWSENKQDYEVWWLVNGRYYQGELIHALWQAVKAVL